MLSQNNPQQIIQSVSSIPLQSQNHSSLQQIQQVQQAQAIQSKQHRTFKQQQPQYQTQYIQQQQQPIHQQNRQYIHDSIIPTHQQQQQQHSSYYIQPSTSSSSLPRASSSQNQINTWNTITASIPIINHGHGLVRAASSYTAINIAPAPVPPQNVYLSPGEQKPSNSKSSVSKQLRAYIMEYAEHLVESLFQCDHVSAQQQQQQQDMNSYFNRHNPYVTPPHLPTTSPATPTQPALPPLTKFIGHILYRTRVSIMTLVLALHFLRRLKQLHPVCKGSYGSGHRLILASVITASKYLYDDTYDNRAWAQVSCGLFKIEEVNQMEAEFLRFLDYRLYIRENEWLGLLDEMDQYFLARYGAHANEERALMMYEMAYYKPTDQIHSCFPVFKPSPQRIVHNNAGLVGVTNNTSGNMISAYDKTLADGHARLRKNDSGFDDLHQIVFY